MLIVVRILAWVVLGGGTLLVAALLVTEFLENRRHYLDDELGAFRRIWEREE